MSAVCCEAGQGRHPLGSGFPWPVANCTQALLTCVLLALPAVGSMMWVAKQNTTMYCTPAPTPDLGSPSTLQLPSGPNSTLIVNSPEVFMAALFIATSELRRLCVPACRRACAAAPS